MVDKEVVHIKLDKRLLKAVDHVAVDMDVYRVTAVEELLYLGLREKFLGSALGPEAEAAYNAWRDAVDPLDEESV